MADGPRTAAPFEEARQPQDRDAERDHREPDGIQAAADDGQPGSKRDHAEGPHGDAPGDGRVRADAPGRSGILRLATTAALATAADAT